MTDYAFINADDPENKKVFFATRGFPTILEIEYPRPELDPKLFKIEENKLSEWDVQEDKVLATYTVTERTLEEEKEKIIKFFNHVYQSVKDGGLSILNGDEKVYVDTKEDNLDFVIESLKDMSEPIDWKEKDPVQWETVDKKRLELIKTRIIDHHEKCDDRLEDLIGLVEASQTIQALHEIEYLEGWSNVIIVTYEDDSVKMFLMNELLDEDRRLKYEKTASGPALPAPKK